MEEPFYDQLSDDSISGRQLSRDICRQILTSDDVGLIPLINAAYKVREKLVGKDVTIHIINNAQNGHCPEDCRYCAQAKPSTAAIKEYPLKSDDEIVAEAQNAYEKGAHRYCMVFAGRGPSKARIDHLAGLIRAIKSRYPVEVCVSAGLLDQGKAQILKEAGLDRLNHNLNTSARHYPKICTTHTYEDRINTLQAARQAGLQICSGIILGMGENSEDVIDMACTLRQIKAESIPVNFFIPIEGTQLATAPVLSPEYCLRVLCLYRFLNPDAEIRIAAGRERYLRSMEVLALFPANSLFLDGYLNVKGGKRARTLQMIKDAGFTVRSEHSLDDLIANEQCSNGVSWQGESVETQMKNITDLRPQLTPDK